jgi:hypothetical protein
VGKRESDCSKPTALIELAKDDSLKDSARDIENGF